MICFNLADVLADLAMFAHAFVALYAIRGAGMEFANLFDIMTPHAPLSTRWDRKSSSSIALLSKRW